MWDTYGMDVLTVYADAVKSDRLGHVKGYLVRFGDAESPDLEGDYFTASTDYGFPAKGQKVPLNLYYHHGMDGKVGKKCIGTGSVKMDDMGLWYEGQLDLADEYGKMIAKLCKQGKMGFSSGAAAHMVERKSVGMASEITRWCIAEASITPTPAEYRNSVKSLEEYYGMEPMEEEEMEIPEQMPEQSAEEYTAELFKIAEADVIHEGIEAYYDAMCEGIMMAAEQSTVDAIIDGFASRAKQLYAMHGTKSVTPASLRGVERRLRDAVGLSRSEAKRLAPVVWDSLRDADQPVAEPVIEVKAQATDKDERQELLARLEILSQL